MKKSWMPKVAGVISIISGAFGLLAVLGLIIAAFITSGSYIEGTEDVPDFVPNLLIGLAVPLAISSILSFIGGSYAIQAKKWGWALTGSVAAIFSSIPLLGGIPGIIAAVLTALSKDDFE